MTPSPSPSRLDTSTKELIAQQMDCFPVMNLKTNFASVITLDEENMITNYSIEKVEEKIKKNAKKC